MNVDEVFMRRCLDLAENARGNVAPNPMVGCVIVHQNTIIAEGYHQEYGKAHAEVMAINSVKNKELLKESCLYVNLEPCSHFGKTPPCADLIIQQGIPKVVICNVDSFQKVAGSGIQKLRSAGIEVINGILENDGRRLNARFFCFHEKKRPYVILKWAQTADGFMDIDRGSSKDEKYWISSPLSKLLVHKWRSEESAIFVGSNTIKNDNPSLTVRLVEGKNPIRICIDKNLVLEQSSAIFDNTAKSYIFNEKTNKTEGHLEYIKVDFGKSLIAGILDILYQKEIQSLIVEGGHNILQQFIDQNVWDEVRVFQSEKNFLSGLCAPRLQAQLVSSSTIQNDRLSIYKNESSL